MCEDCFTKKFKGFTFQSDYDNFKETLDRKCFLNKVEILEDINALQDFRIYYKCKTCNEKYILSIPDYAWRGYFLTYQNAINYHNFLSKSDRRKRNTFIITMILLAVILFAYYITK